MVAGQKLSSSRETFKEKFQQKASKLDKSYLNNEGPATTPAAAVDGPSASLYATFADTLLTTFTPGKAAKGGDE